MKKLLQRWLGINKLTEEVVTLRIRFELEEAKKSMSQEIIRQWESGIDIEMKKAPDNFPGEGIPLTPNEIAVVKGYDRP